jgi:histidinol-phosphate aminotransferase
MQTRDRAPTVVREGRIPFLPPLVTERHQPGLLRARTDYVYRPPITVDCTLSLERQETTRPAPVDVIEAEHRRRRDFPGQETCRYPSKLVEGALVAELARRHALSERAFLVGSGIMSLLTTVYSAFARPGDSVVVPSPGFWPAYSFAVQRGLGVLMPTYEWAPEDELRGGFRFPTEDVVDAIARPDARICYLCAPDNPTGTRIPHELVRELVEAFPGKLFVVDAAYWAYDWFEQSSTGTIRGGLAAHVSAALVREGAPNVLGAFTFSKHYALANHRVGYLIGHEDLITTVRCHQGPYGMSEIDLALAYYNLENDAYAEENVRAVCRNKRRLEMLLTVAGQPFVSGSHNALSLKGERWREALADEGIAVRALDYFEGIPNPLAGYYRLAIPTDHDRMELLVSAIERIVARG